MYPISTSSKKIIYNENEQDSAHKVSRQEMPVASHLTLHDDPASVYQEFEIDMPYIILYETVNYEKDYTVYQEYSENSQMMFRNTCADLADLTKKLHSHKFYEMTFVLSGELTLRIENEDIVYHTGDCCICNKNIHHVEQMGNGAEIVLFLIREEYIHDVCGSNFFYESSGAPKPLSSIFDVFFRANKKNPLYDAKIYSDFRCKNKGSDSALVLINQMISEITGLQSGKSHMMKALFCRLFELLQDPEIYATDVHVAKLSGDEQIVANIANAYRKKFGIFTRAEIEKITGYNGDHVERIVRRTTGRTLSEFGRDSLVQHAADLLINSDLSVSEICEKAGYTNRNYFNKIFLQKYNCVPSEFRKKYRQLKTAGE